ncbi:MAG: peptidylprolyl isomerase [Chloroflexi bacterium]|nr:peptidylprolyl isomerase [Chloroflexota bacterium]
MTKKSHGEKPIREMNKHQLSRWQAQQRRQRIILGAGLLVILAVVAVLSIGWFTVNYQPLHATVIKVNSTSFNMGYYVDWIAFRSKTQPAEYRQYAADAAVQEIEQTELIRQEAEKLGIKVNKDEVDRRLKSLGYSDSRVARDFVTGQLLIDKVRDDYLAPKQVPDSLPQAKMEAMLLDSERRANEIRAEIEKGKSFAEMAGLASVNVLTKQKKGDLGYHPQAVFEAVLDSKVPGDYAFGSAAGVLSQPRHDPDVSKQVGYWLIQLVNRSEATADVNAMLLGSDQRAEEVRAKLVAGESFANLAKEFSQLANAKDNGGSLTSVSKGSMGTAFDAFAFNPDAAVGTLSQPIRDESLMTKGGYWLVNVLEKSDSRPLDDADRQTMKQRALETWASQIITNPENVVDDSYLDQAKRAWALLRATASPKGRQG